MDLPTSSKSDAPVSVIGSRYCDSSPLQLRIGRKVESTSSDGNFVVTNIKGSVVFKVQEKEYTMRDRRVLVDGAGDPIVTIRKKTISAHKRWKVFKGEGDEKSNLLFTVRRSSMLREKNKLHVFLAENINEDVCDFKVEKNQSENLLLVYRGESSTVLAEMHKKSTTGTASISKDNYAVTICGNIDYSFIISLIVIYDECNDGSQNNWLRPLGKLGLDLLRDLAIGVASNAIIDELSGKDENKDEDEEGNNDENKGEDER